MAPSYSCYHQFDIFAVFHDIGEDIIDGVITLLLWYS